MQIEKSLRRNRPDKRALHSVASPPATSSLPSPLRGIRSVRLERMALGQGVCEDQMLETLIERYATRRLHAASISVLAGTLGPMVRLELHCTRATSVQSSTRIAWSLLITLEDRVELIRDRRLRLAGGAIIWRKTELYISDESDITRDLSTTVEEVVGLLAAELERANR